MDSRSKQKAKISLPGEIIEEILSRLPVKSLLRFQSVSKPWRSLISNQSFTKLHFNRSTAALFISAYDKSKRKLYFFSDAASLTHLITLDDVLPSTRWFSDAVHLKGLICFTLANGRLPSNCAFIVNPSTHNIFKLPHPPTNHGCGVVTCYLFGFDEPRNEHKILNISFLRSLYQPEPYTFEISIFSMSTYSWRKVNAELPIESATDLYSYSVRRSVCVDSVIHLVLGNSFDILMFDLTTEKFSKITTPGNVVPCGITTPFARSRKFIRPRIIIIDGCVGVVCHDHVAETNAMHIWILQDYESHVWVKETIVFPESWISLGSPFPSDYVKRDEIIFFPSRLSGNLISVPTYNMNRRCYKLVQFTLNHPLLRLKDVEFNEIKCYVESTLPLEANRTRTR